MKIKTTSNEKKIFLMMFIMACVIGLFFLEKHFYPNATDEVTVIALLIGPVLAVIVTRYNDKANSTYERRLMSFRELMKFRTDFTSKEFVGALNLIVVDFNDEKKVQDAWKDLFQALHPNPQPTDQTLWYFNTQDLLIKLLDEIGQCLDIEINPMDIKQKYAPQQWLTDKNRNDAILNGINVFLMRVMGGKNQNDKDDLILNNLVTFISDISLKLKDHQKNTPP